MASKKKHIIGWITAFSIAFGIILFCRAFLIESYIIQDTSMCNALLPGDFVVINKTKYGPRMPITPISSPWSDDYSDAVEFPYRKMNGRDSIKRNDIVAFNYPLDTTRPIDKRDVMIQRLIGLPGDTIQMNRKSLYVNLKRVVLPTTQYSYLVGLKNKENLDLLIEKYNLTEGGRFNKKDAFKMFFTKQTSEEIQKDSLVKYLYWFYQYAPGEYMFNSMHNICGWNHDNIDPFVVPGEGVTVRINKENIGAYEMVIRYYEKNSLNITDSFIYINHQPSSYYTFRNNYYFMLADNRDNANDSRNWGFVPEEFIIGRSTMILFSYNYKAPWYKLFRGGRFFRKIQ